jgi:hypothetical protein
MTASGIQSRMDGVDSLLPAEIVLNGQGHLAKPYRRGVIWAKIAV